METLTIKPHSLYKILDNGLLLYLWTDWSLVNGVDKWKLNEACCVCMWVCSCFDKKPGSGAWVSLSYKLCLLISIFYVRISSHGETLFYLEMGKGWQQKEHPAIKKNASTHSFWPMQAWKNGSKNRVDSIAEGLTIYTGAECQWSVALLR